MTKHLLALLLALLAVVALAAPAPPASAETEADGGATCETECKGCATCKIFTDGGYNCTGCPRPTTVVQFSDEGTARISLPVDERRLERLGLRGAPGRLSLSPIPGIFSVDSSRMVSSRIDGAEGQTAIFEVTLAPGVTPDMVLESLLGEAFFTVESPSHLGEVLIPAEDLLSTGSRGLVIRDE